MGQAVIIMGESGNGKSYSMRNLDMDEVGIFECAGKLLPFRGGKCANKKQSGYHTIAETLRANNKRLYVVDDAGYLMTWDLFAAIDESGYSKFERMAKRFEQLVQTACDETDGDTLVYFMMHVDKDQFTGRHKPKTAGKMIENVLVFEGLTNIILGAFKDQDGYHFVTNTTEDQPYKSPPGMFEQVMDNDLKAVDDAIREYYDMKPAAKSEEKE